MREEKETAETRRPQRNAEKKDEEGAGVRVRVRVGVGSKNQSLIINYQFYANPIIHS